MGKIYFHINKQQLKGLFYLFLLICCFQSHPGFCQPIENHFTHYTTKEGLLDGGITNMIQDSTGFLWIGFENGLSRFDGHSFKTYRYDPADTNSLRENRIYSFFIDSKNRFWIATRHWLYLFHSKDGWFEHFNINTLSPEATFDYICGEEKDQLILTGSPDFFKFDISQKKFSFFYHKGMSPKPGGDYKKDEDGIEWMGGQYGLTRYDPKTKKSFLIDSIRCHLKEYYPVKKIILLPNGYLIADTYENGLLLVNRKTFAFKEFTTHDINPEAPLEQVSPGTPVNNRIDCTYKLNDSIILCSCSGGLSIFNWRRETFTYFKPNKSDPASLLEENLRISSILKDREGIIWLGGGYLEKYDYKDYNIKVFSPNEKKKSLRPFAPFFDLNSCSDGEFLLGSFSTVGIYDTARGLEDYISLVRVNFFREDNLGNIWCRVPDGIGFFNKEKWKHEIKKYKIPTIIGSYFKTKKNVERIWSIIARYKGLEQKIKTYKIPGTPQGFYDLKLDKKGHVLIATNGEGLVIFDTTAKTYTFFNSISRPPSQLTNSSTTAICEDHSGCIWIGTQKGLNKIEADGITVKQYSQNKKWNALLSDWWVNDIKEDKHGIIWFTTNEHGIGRIDPSTDSVRFFSVAQGLPTCNFEELCIDDEDNLWARSTMGVLNMNVVTLQNKLYAEEEGFPSPTDIQTIHYSEYTKKLYILTPYAILEINSKNLNHIIKIPPTTITSFSVFDKERAISTGKEIPLAYDENFINIQFALLLFHSNRQIKYAYKLEGIDKEWVYSNYKRNASYTNLPPGHYVFNVKAQSPDGIWNYSPTTLSIIIHPPIWQTWWFYLAEAIAVLAFLFWIVRLYTQRKLSKQKMEFENLKAVSNERTRIAADMHDDLGSGLTSIRLLSEVANLKAGKDGAAKLEIEKIVKSVENLSQNLREIVWTMNTRFDKPEDFIIYVRIYAVEFFENSDIKFQFKAPQLTPEVTMPGKLRRNVFLCIKEALNNVVKHSGATEASLTFNFIGNVLYTEIKDNGVGIDSNQTKKFGNGLNSMKERLKRYGSDLKIEVNNGTALKFEINV